MAEYPAHLVRQHRLRDGRTVTIRPVRADDEALEREFMNQLSGESRYLRFQKWINAPSEKLIHFLTDIDYDKHLALVCTLPRASGEELVGEARYVADAEGKDCEFGIMIADSWHKSGIAGLLMEALISAARVRKLAMMEGQVLTRNSAMLRFARGLGFEIQRMPDDPATTRIVKKL
jgi:acetyltransferase